MYTPPSCIDQEFRLSHDIVALEGGNLAVDAMDLFKRTFPGIMEGFQSFVNKFTNDQPAIKLTRDQSKFVKALQDVPYLELSPVTVFVPEGMTTSYLGYAAKLASAVDYAVGAPERLSQLIRYAEVVLTNRDRIYHTQSNIKSYRNMADQRADLLADLATCFTAGSTKSETQYGKVVARNSEWPNVFHSVEKINQTIDKVDRTKMNNDLKRICGLLTSIQDMYKSGQLEGMNAALIREIGEGAYQLAQEMEFFAVIYFRVMGLTASVNQTVASVTKIVNR